MLNRWFGLICLIVLSGCENILEIELKPVESEITVTSVFTENDPWQVLLQPTVSIQEASSIPPVIANARVTIEGSDGSFTELAHKGGGFYYSGTSLPQLGIRYTLKVESDQYSDVEASDQIPMPAIVERILYTQDKKQLKITINDEKDFLNYYAISLISKNIQRISFLVKNPELDDQMRRFALQDPFQPFIDRPMVGTAYIHDLPFDGDQFDLSLELDYDVTQDLTVLVNSISKEYYDYAVSVGVQENIEDLPFAEPAPIQSNIHGGQGFFVGHSLYVDGNLSPTKLKKRVLDSFYLSYYSHLDDLNPIAPTIEFTLHDDHSVTGMMEIPPTAENDDKTVTSLNGGFTLRSTLSIRGPITYLVQLHHDQHTFFRNSILEIDINPISEMIYLTSVQDALTRDERAEMISRRFDKKE